MSREHGEQIPMGALEGFERDRLADLFSSYPGTLTVQADPDNTRLSVDIPTRDFLKIFNPPAPERTDLASKRYRGLTSRQIQIIVLAASGLTSKVIANQLSLSSPRTVENHIARICRRLGVSTRVEAAVWAAQNGLLPQSKYPQANPGGLEGGS